MLIRGADLTDAQRGIVLATFVHRWTVENAFQTYQGRCPACVQALAAVPLKVDGMPYTIAEWHAHHTKLTTDREWLAAHAFHFVKDGSRLHARRKHAEPVWRAETRRAS